LFNESLLSVYRKYQAYALWPKIYFEYWSNSIRIEELVINESLMEDQWIHAWCTDKENLLLNTAIRNCIVKPSWKKSMSRGSFVNGYKK
jgi:methionyl-tRNA formyltransferase